MHNTPNLDGYALIAYQRDRQPKIILKATPAEYSKLTKERFTVEIVPVAVAQALKQYRSVKRKSKEYAYSCR